MDGVLLEVGLNGCDGAREADGAGKVVNDEDLKAQAGGRRGRVADAEVECEAGEEEAGEGAFAEVGGKTGGGDAVIFEESRVGVGVFSPAFAKDELRVGDVETGVEGGAGRVLEAVVGPKGLASVGSLDGAGEGLLAGVGAGEGDVAGRVPVLGEDDVLKAGGELIDAGNDLERAFDFERGTREHEVVLHVDDEKGVVPGERKRGHVEIVGVGR